MTDLGSFVAVSNTTAKFYRIDNQGKPSPAWQDSSQQPQGSVNWLKNGKAFLTAQGGTVVAHVLENLKDKDKPPVILNLPSGPLLGRVSGDGKCLVLVQSSVPSSINVYDLQSLLGATAGPPAKPPVILQDHDRPIVAIAASVNTTHIASSNSIGAVYLHEAGSGARSTLGALPGGPMMMTPKRCLAFSQMNKPLRLAAGADDGQVLVWQVTPMASGPVVMPTKLRGRVMGVGFATYKQEPSSVLLACSESGQLHATDLRNFPNVQSKASFSTELQVGVSCMTVRDDGQVVAVGTKDGRVGLLRVDDLVQYKENLPKASGLIRVIDLGTHLDVVDIAFQRVREPRDSRDHSRDSRDNSLASAPSAQAPESSAAQAATASDAADGRPGIGRVAEPCEGLEEQPPLKKHAHSVPMAAGSGSHRQTLSDKHDAQVARTAPAATAGTAAAGPSQRVHPTSLVSSTGATGGPGTRPGTATQPAAPANTAGATGAAAEFASGGASTAGLPGPLTVSQTNQSQAPRHPGVSPVIIPGVAPPVGQHRRLSELDGGAGSGSTTPTGAAEEVAGADGHVQTSPAARAAAAAVAVTSSPVSSPLRPRSPRGTISGGGFPPARPYGSSGGDAMSAAGLRSYLDDFRQEMRDLVRGLQADMVRQFLAMEIAHRNDIAVVQQDIRLLSEQIDRLQQNMDANLRFGLLGRQNAPWQ